MAEGYDVVGFDIERHDYGTGGYPAQLVIQDVLTLDGSQFRDAALIVASPPCQAAGPFPQGSIRADRQNPAGIVQLHRASLPALK